MFKQLLLLNALLAFVFASPAHSACDQKWTEIYTDESVSGDDKIQLWEALSPDCSGDASYDHRLAYVYSLSARFDKAEKILKQAINKYTDPYDLAVLEYDLIDLERARVFYAGSPGNESIRNVLAKFLKHIEKYKNHALGYSAAASLYLLLAEPEKTVEYCVKALEIEPDYVGYRTLAMALTSLGKYDQAVNSAILASELNPGYPRDIGLMMSIAYAYISMGDVENAKAILGTLLKERPEMKESEGFNQLVGFVYEKAEELETPEE